VSDVIPLVDLGWQHRQIAGEVTDAIWSTLDRTDFVLGADVARFEEEFAAYTGVPHCVGVASGTDALELALRALDIGPQDEVIVPANTFVATAAAVARVGAIPVFVDVDEQTLLVDPSRVAEAITGRTAAVVAVHLFGQMAPVEALADLCDRHGLALVEDAAQSQGARRHGFGVAARSRIAATSFYPGKNLGAYGDGGAVLTRDEQLAQRVRRLRNHGGIRKYEHLELGTNSRLDTIQAAVLRCKLRRLDEWNALRRAAAAVYDEALSSVQDVRTPVTAEGNEHVWHLYVVRVPHRDAVLQELNDASIGAGIHYPVPVHLLPAFESRSRSRECPVAERAAGEILSLPLYPGLTCDQQHRVVARMTTALASR
jgi:dTDP-4-amino-4,6-dideoxygalactose transaminase